MPRASTRSSNRSSAKPRLAPVAGFSASATRRKGDWFDVEELQRLETFFGLLRHTKGIWAGRPFDLLPWQRDLLGALLCWKRADGTRRFRSAYIEIPRKNGKSTLLAAIGLYMLLCDHEQGAEVYCCASARDQAAIVGDACRQMVQSNPELAAKVEVFRNVITFGTSKLEVLSSDAGTKHGKNASCVIFDEVHTFADRDLYDAMVTSMGARTQPLQVCITTAGHDRESLCWELHDYAAKVRDGIIDDPAFMPVLFSAPVEADWKSPKVWRQCNPSLGITVSEEFLRAECEKAKELPTYETTFRQLYLCQWTESKRVWISSDAWAACASSAADADSLQGRECWGGLDLSTTTDLSSLALVFPSADGSVDVLSWTWCPEEGIRRRSRTDRAPYDVWASKGHLFPTPGSRVDYDHIAARIRDVFRRYQVRHIGYDPWNATHLASGLYTEGVPMLEVRQGFRTLSEPCKRLEALVTSRNIRHPDNCLLNWAVSNTVVDQDPAGNLKPSKSSSTERIDPLAALVTALATWVHQREEHGPSVYEERTITWV
jgi:phage terminase large subunit-like protein